jgi:hypothetical protein
MLKLASLRKLIEQCVPDLARDPERLQITGEGGRVVATGTAALSFEYQYTAAIAILDYNGHTDALFVPLLAWMQVNQPEQLDNEAARAEAITFEVHPLHDASMDIGIWLDLTERAIVRRAPAQGAAHRLSVEHPEEPDRVGAASLPEHWELWLRDQIKLGEWDIAAPPAREWFKPAL